MKCNFRYYTISLLLFVFCTGCEKFLDIDNPKTQTVTPTVYSSDATAQSAISGIYSYMVSIRSFAAGGTGSVTMLAALSADELVASGFAGDMYRMFQANTLLPITPDVKSSIWEPGYKLIYFANALLEGLNTSTAITDSTKRQLQGEAKFIRAFCHFYLLNFFGNIPLVTTTSYTINNAAKRTDTNAVYQQIIADLKEAQTLLANNYAWSGGERIRPNKWAATALLARVYLYTGNWVKAEAEATAVINHTALYNLVSEPNAVFLKNSNETIWQLKPVEAGKNAYEGGVFLFQGTPVYVAFPATILTIFEASDKRAANWVGSDASSGTTYYFPYKYKIDESPTPIEYSTVLRLAEQYLVRAEARAQLNHVAGAQADIDQIRTRAGLGNTLAGDKASLLLAIEQERKIEFLVEWGHRWFDLKRWNRANAVLGPIKGADWQTTDVWYPIPQTEIQNNPNLTQNDGYN
jgi:hypothetical protein